MSGKVREPILPAITLNVSKEGLGLETTWEMPVGSQVEIITPWTQNDRKIVVPARVVRLERRNSGEHYLLGLELLPGEADNRDWEEFLIA